MTIGKTASAKPAISIPDMLILILPSGRISGVLQEMKEVRRVVPHCRDVRLEGGEVFW